MEILELPPEHVRIASKPFRFITKHLGLEVGLTYGSITKDSKLKQKSDYRDNIEERKGYKMTNKELLYLLYFQRYEYFRTENNKKWLNSVGRCVLMVLTYLNTLGTHGASFFHF